MPADLNINQKEQTTRPKNSGGIRARLRQLAYFAVIIATAYAVHQIFFMVRLTAGISNEKPSAKYFATVEIINASGTSGLGKQLTEFLHKNISREVEIAVVNAERLDYRNIEKTIVISRIENTKMAEYVAETIGLKKSEVVYRPSVDNDKSPKVTLVLGEDIQQVLNPQKPTKES